MADAHRVAVIPGDGIGSEVVPAAVRCTDAIAAEHGFELDWTFLDWGADRYRRCGSMMPSDGLRRLDEFESIFLGAVGAPDIPDSITLWGLLIPIRQGLQQYVNLRPARSRPGIAGPLRDDRPVDILVVRENVEGEYTDIGGRAYAGTPSEIAVQQAIFSRAGVRRIAQFAADRAAERSGRLISATKSNGIPHTMPFWDAVVDETVGGRDDVALEHVLVDALTARIVLKPETVDVIVASNLFGDIVSDLTGALVGSLGLVPSGNINPERAHPSMFEPVHGSAPDIAGRGIANPMGAIATAAMMLDDLGHPEAAEHLDAAVDAVLASGLRTPDLGGSSGTGETADAVVSAVRRRGSSGGEQTARPAGNDRV